MAKEKAPHMPWYGREFYSDENVIVMTLEQEAAYLRLLWNCWQEGSIPRDTAKLAAISKNVAPRRFERMIWPALVNCFTETPDGRLMHPKVEALRAAKNHFRAECSEAGKRGAGIRWAKGTDSGAIGYPIETLQKGDRVSMPADCRLPITEEKTITPCSSADERGEPNHAEKPLSDEIKAWFDSEFWPLYPRRVAKPKALLAARRHAKTHADRATILECLRRRLPDLQAQLRADGDFRPYPASWLNQTPWLDADDATAVTAPRIEYFDASYLKDDSD